MRRLASTIIMVALGGGAGGGVALGQDTAPRKLIAPVRGEAVVEITQPDTKITGNEVVTTFRVKNVSTGPIAGFRIDENWYKGNQPVAGDQYRHPRPLPVGEVIQIQLKTPRNMIVGARNQYQFSHANGTIKPKTVPKLDLPKPMTD